MFPISIFFLLIVWIANDSYDSLDSCPLFVPSLEQDTPKPELHIFIFGCALAILSMKIQILQFF